MGHSRKGAGWCFVFATNTFVLSTGTRPLWDFVWVCQTQVPFLQGENRSVGEGQHTLCAPAEVCQAVLGRAGAAGGPVTAGLISTRVTWLAHSSLPSSVLPALPGSVTFPGKQAITHPVNGTASRKGPFSTKADKI